MCAADRTVKLDLKEAYECGKEAVRLALQGVGGVMVTIQRTSTGKQPYATTLGTIPLKEVANHERPMPDKYISQTGMDVTPAFLDYVRPLVGELPTFARLPKPRKKTAPR
jgi:6-phosphofructokinase 1